MTGPRRGQVDTGINNDSLTSESSHLMGQLETKQKTDQERIEVTLSFVISDFFRPNETVIRPESCREQ